MLGAGKTTFIRHFVKHITGKAVVLVNDFGKAGIDGEVFSAGGIESIELPSGCVCCTLKFDLIATVRKIIDLHNPDHLVIEPSGIASPSGILDALETLNITSYTVVGIIDATEFLELNHEDAFGRFFADHVAHSDIILVNKTDLVDDGTADSIVHTVGKMNGHAIVLRTVDCIIGAAIPEISGAPRTINREAPHLPFETISLKFTSDVDRETIATLFHDMAIGKYGDIVRAKALVNTLQGPYKFDLSFVTVQCVPFQTTVAGSRLVVIGQGLRKEALLSSVEGVSTGFYPE